jgi:hypothetical protein
MPAVSHQAPSGINTGKSQHRCASCSGTGFGWQTTRTRANAMQTFFFDMKDGIPMRDRVGLEFKGNAEAIQHCKELAQHFRDESLRDDQELEISVVNALGREIHREFVHRQ